MTAKKQSITISGGTIQGSAVGIGHVEQHGGTMAQGADVASLRAALDAGTDEIVALGRDDDERAELAVDLRKIRRELDGENPDGTVVRTRWESVLKALGSSAGAISGISTITGHVATLFGS